MITFDKEYFSISDTLECGQVFRFKPFESGYLVMSADKLAYVYETASKVYIDGDDYFYDYFDLSKDYKNIVNSVIGYNIPAITSACEKYKGIRILKQSKYEALISFIISQNNNIPRIKSIIERLCQNLGEKKCYNGIDYFTFPSLESLAEKDEEFYKSMGLGYRAEYIEKTAKGLLNGEIDLEKLNTLSTEELRKSLLKIKGIGEKVADCVIFFGFGRTDSFPVDTWIEKFYKEDLQGELTDRKRISTELVSKFKEYSGYVQQYVFHAKRNQSKC